MQDTILKCYLKVKQVVIDAGYIEEITWQNNVSFEQITEQIFLSEAAWVILSCGMSEKVIRDKFQVLSPIFFNWESAYLITNNEKECKQKALNIYNHAGKIDGIFRIAKHIHNKGFIRVKNDVSIYGLEYLMQFPFIGPATSLHLAKNLGLDVVKPDRHLMRMSKVLGYESPYDLCSYISLATEDKISVVDLILWRFATLENDYIKCLEEILSQH